MSPIGRFRPPDSRFAHVHVDVVGPLPTVNGQTHLLTCVDRFTRWAEANLSYLVLIPFVYKADLCKVKVEKSFCLSHMNSCCTPETCI